ncbi:hypothetical protein FRC10_011771 [Ceratobasidium sp. 414]|nr:hypothetical protein FRC10_011771 [Ceratobasidium sp. 414]
MATTRSKRKAMGVAAPDLDQLQNRPDSAAARARKFKTVTIEDVPDGWAGFQREGSADLDIPGSFAASPVNAGGYYDLDTDSEDERIAETHISTIREVCTDIESCHSRESIGKRHESEPCPQTERTSTPPYPAERTVKTGPGPLTYPTEWETTFEKTSTPAATASAEVTLPSITRFQTPSRKARMYDKMPIVKLDGAKYFPTNVHDAEIHAPPEPEPEQKSDEMLKQTSKPKRMKSAAQQHEEDMAYLRAAIKDNKRRRRLQEMLPDIIPNNKSLLDEMRIALQESSGSEGYESSFWEDDIYEIESVGEMGGKRNMYPEPTPQAGPSYFEKEKWVRGSDYETNQKFKAKQTAEQKDVMSKDEGHKTTGKNIPKRARPSLGIKIDDVRPPEAKPPRANATLTADDLKASIKALPAGGYFAEKIRAKSLVPDRTMSKSRQWDKTPSDDNSQSSSSSSSQGTQSDSESDQSDSEPSDSSDGADGTHTRTISEKRKRQNAKNRDRYREKNKKLKKKVKKAQHANLKLKEPTAYRGQENYNEFELWDYEIEQWISGSGLSDRKAVRYLGTFLKDKAARWYMDFVAPNPERYTVDTIKIGLFAYCFPADLKAKLRREFKYARQGNQKFVDYLQQLWRLQRRIPDITDHQLCIKLWDTVQTYIKIKWIEAGLDAEVSELETLTSSAERYEAVEEVKRRAGERREYPKPRYTEQKGERRDEGRKEQPNAPRKPQNQPKPQAGPSRTPNRPRDKKPRTEKSKLSRDERNELRAAGKCFSCKETGHTIKDCPSRTTAKPSGIYSAAVQYDYDLIERLRKERENTYVSIASIQPDDNATDSGTSYGTSEEITPAGSLLTKILDQITPYAQIIVAENDRFRITNNDLLTFEMSYAEIAQQVRETYLEIERERTRIEQENNQTLLTVPEEGDMMNPNDEWEFPEWSESDEETLKPETADINVQLNALRIGEKKRGETSTRTVERNASRPKDITRKLPKPLVVEASIDGQKVRALIDTGSLGDFISTTVVDQLKLKRETLAKPIGLQMAVTGSRSTINHSVTARLAYQGIDENHRFDVINIDNYDLILGTPFLYQYEVIVSFKPPTVSIGSRRAQPIHNESALVIESLATQLFKEKIEERREALWAYSADLCKSMAETPLPPFRAINHTIPIIDETKRYNVRRVQCPKPLQSLFDKKFAAYHNTGRWEHKPGINAIPMLIMMKKAKDGKVAVRTVLDKRDINANTHKLASPLPDINEILMEVSRHPYRSLIDGKDAYEQIHVIPEHVPRTLFMTPKGTMVSHVMQQGDCNAGATYQALMNHIFTEYIGKFMFVYLDDIIIFSDTAEEHEKHVKMVFDVLRKEKLYLSPHKMQLFAERLEILGHVITCEGISMDPHKVDTIEKWKTQTSKEQLASFLGAVGYLAPNCAGIRIPMGVLSRRASATQTWRWEATEQRAFSEIQRIVSDHKDLNRVALDYSPGAPPINLTTDACCTGASGVVSQGEDLKTAKIVAFWSGKFTATQQNYPVHEQELLAIKESLERFKNLLQGVKIRVFTDHKALEFFHTQKKLSARQTRWLEKINEFDIEVKYIPGETNVLADALSRMYSDEPEGIVRHKSEYVHDADEDTPHILVGSQERKQVEKYLGQPQRKRRTVKVAQPSTEQVAELAENETPTQEESERKPTEQPKEPDSPAKDLYAEPETALTECITEFALPDGLKGRYKEDTLLNHIATHISEHKNFELRNDVLYIHNKGELLLDYARAFDNGTLRRQEDPAVATHTSLVERNGGRHRKLLCIMQNMRNKQDKYPKTDGTAASDAGPLPESETRYGKFDMITTVVDNLTRMVHLIPTRQDYTAKDVAEIVFEHVYKLHGMPERIVSDRDSLFTSEFWTRLAELTKTELRMSSAYHPQTDGMTERAQRTYTSLLRICTGKKQKDWAKSLPAIEFAINSARSDTTGLSPFYLNYGRTPSLMVQNTDSKFPGVREHVERIKLAIMKAHDAIIDSRARMTRQANKHRQKADFKEGDLVYISTQNMRILKGEARKLTLKYIGPTYRPMTENSLGGNTDKSQPWAVDKIVSHKGRGQKAVFEILWKTGDKTWEPLRTIKHLEALTAYLEVQGMPSVGKLAMSPTDDVEGSEPEDYELNSVQLVVGKDAVKSRRECDTTHPPSPPILNSISTDAMSQDSASIQLTKEGLECILNAHTRAQVKTNNALIRMARETGAMMGSGERGRGGRKYSHRQRKTKAAKLANEDPASKNDGRYQRGRERKPKAEGSGHVDTTHTDLLALAQAGWNGTGFDTQGGTTLTGHDLIPATPGGTPTILSLSDTLPVPSYTPPTANDHIVPTQVTQPSGQATTHSTGPTHNPPNADSSNTNAEDSVDYEDDYNMDGAEGTGGQAEH